MMRRHGSTTALAALLVAASVHAAPQDHTCTLTTLEQQTFSPVALPPFVVPLTGNEDVAVTIDPDTGDFTIDGSALQPLHFRNGFSDAWDVLYFPSEPKAGTIDAAGNIIVPAVEYRVCTFGTCPGGGTACDCVPSNLCSNDTSRICLPGVTSGDLACEAGGTCQGVCSDDLTKTCANDVDCLPAGFCGTGSMLRLTPDLTTGTATLGNVSLTGSAESAFVDGKIVLVDVFNTSVETPVIGDTGITSVTLGCTLDPVPNGDTLPPPPAWSVKKGTVKLAKEPTGAGDDKLTLKGDFLPLGGEADFAAEDLVVTLGTGDATVVSLRVPAGSLTANKKGTKWKLADKTGSVIQVSPPLPPGSAPSHKLTIKRKKDGQHALALASKNLDLDDLDVEEITSGIIFGFQTPTTTSAVKVKGSKRTF
jgi:hypothetical protein